MINALLNKVMNGRILVVVAGKKLSGIGPCRNEVCLQAKLGEERSVSRVTERRGRREDYHAMSLA